MNKINQNKEDTIDKRAGSPSKYDGHLLLSNEQTPTVVPEVTAIHSIQNVQYAQPIQYSQPIQPTHLIPLATAIPLDSSMIMHFPVPLAQVVVPSPPIPSTSPVLNSLPSIQGYSRYISSPITTRLNQS